MPDDLLQSITEILGSNPDIAAVQTVYSPECTTDELVSIYQNLYYYHALAHVKAVRVAIFATWC